MGDRTAARRYAKAFIELSESAGNTDRLAGDLSQLAQKVPGTELWAALCNPVFTVDERKAVLKAVFPKLGLQPLTENLLSLLLEKGRFTDLPEIASAFNEMADERANRAHVLVETAEPLTAQLEAEIRAALGRVTGKEVILQSVVKPELIGGLVARVGSRVYDASVRSRLEDIRQKLISAQVPAEA